MISYRKTWSAGWKANPPIRDLKIATTCSDACRTPGHRAISRSFWIGGTRFRHNMCRLKTWPEWQPTGGRPPILKASLARRSRSVAAGSIEESRLLLCLSSVCQGWELCGASSRHRRSRLSAKSEESSNEQASSGVILDARATADDCEFMLDMADSIKAALPPEVMSCFNPNSCFDRFHDRVAVGEWISTPSYRVELLRPELARRVYQSKYRTVELSLAMYSLGAATLGDVVEGILGCAVAIQLTITS